MRAYVTRTWRSSFPLVSRPVPQSGRRISRWQLQNCTSATNCLTRNEQRARDRAKALYSIRGKIDTDVWALILKGPLSVIKRETWSHAQTCFVDKWLICLPLTVTFLRWWIDDDGDSLSRGFGHDSGATIASASGRTCSGIGRQSRETPRMLLCRGRRSCFCIKLSWLPK